MQIGFNPPPAQARGESLGPVGDAAQQHPVSIRPPRKHGGNLWPRCTAWCLPPCVPIRPPRKDGGNRGTTATPSAAAPFQSAPRASTGGIFVPFAMSQLVCPFQSAPRASTGGIMLTSLTSVSLACFNPPPAQARGE